MKRIICLGDSNTFGYDPCDLYGEPYRMPWPAVLAEQLDAEVINFGVNGAKIPDTEFRRNLKQKRLLNHVPFDLITVMLGTNDILFTDEPDLSAIEQNLMDLCAFLQKSFAESRILLLVPPYLKNYDPVRTAASMQMKEICERIAEKLQITVVNPNDWNPDMAYDGVHYTEQAHGMIGRNLAEIIRTMEEGR